MTAKLLRTGLLAVSFSAGVVSALAFSQPPKERDDEVAIKFSEAPEPVRAAALKVAPEKNMTKVTRESDDGITTYEVEFTEDGGSGSGTFTRMGDVLEIEHGIPESKLPAAAIAAVRKAYPGTTLGPIVIVTKTYYEVQVSKDGKKHEVRVDASGEIEHEEGDENHEKGGK